MKEDKRIDKANRPGKLAMELHQYYRGKVSISLKAPVRDFSDFAIWYTPGVAKPCLDISKNSENVWKHTNRANTIAVVSDGTRVLGLGDIGPEAAMPVMEGKALLFKYLGGVDAFPLCLREKDPDEIVKIVKAIEPSVGGINLEDISTPKCFNILDRLREEMNIPVWHDDQQGTATVEVAGFINAVKYVGKKLDRMRVTMIGSGAANIRIASILTKIGVRPGSIIMVDSKGILSRNRPDIEYLKSTNKEKYMSCINYNSEELDGSAKDASKGSDAILCASTPVPGTLTKDMIRNMSEKPIVFAAANPEPEIWPWDALDAGAEIVATGRSDFPNQINNSLGFPGIFRGALDVRASTITDSMCIAAAKELAKVAEDKGLSREYIIPNMEEWEVFPREAAAVGVQAIKEGIAQRTFSHEELLEMAHESISRAREGTRILMENNIISRAPEGTRL